MPTNITFAAYAQGAAATDLYPQESKILLHALGLNGEAGEYGDKIKKIYRDRDGVIAEDNRQALAKELGDVLWYVTRAASDLGFTLEEIAQMNHDKLASRFERGKIHGNGDER